MINTLYIINVKYICTYNMYSIYMLSTDLSHIHNWSQNWVIKFNPNKTESILFTRRNINNPPVYFGDMDNRVTDVDTHCHLGLDLQSNCKWGDYVSKIYKKACDRLKILRMLKYQVDRNVLINIYLSFIRPILEYGNVIWDIVPKMKLIYWKVFRLRQAG